MSAPRWIAVRVPRGIDDSAHWAVAEKRDDTHDYRIIVYRPSLAACEAEIAEYKRMARVEATTAWRARGGT